MPEAEIPHLPAGDIAWKNTLEFLAKLTSPVRTAPNPAEFSGSYRDRRDLEITDLYAGTNAGIYEIGRKFGLTGEAVRQIFERTIKKLHNSASADLQEKYPWESLGRDKRQSLAARQRQSAERGGTGIKIAGLIAAGRGNTQKEIREAGISSKQFQSARRTLESWGVQVPAKESILETFKELREPDTNDEKIQELLNKITAPGRYNMLRRAGLIISLSSLARNAGLFVHGRDISTIYNELSSKHLPVKRMNYAMKKGESGYYHFTAATAQTRGMQLLQEAPQFAHLMENPVGLAAGQTDKIPNTNELANSGNYGRIGHLIGKIRGAGLGTRGRVTTKDIITGSPVPVYRLEAVSHYYYPLAQEAELAEHIGKRLRELGLMG